MHKTIEKCRVCGNNNLTPVINLGTQYMDGVFPSRPGQQLDSLPLEVVKCHNGGTDSCCGLLQLKHQHLFNRQYWENYGYRSGLNQSMVASLGAIVNKIESYGILKEGDTVLDIGSNDGTLLKHYRQEPYRLVGMDPGGKFLLKYYPPGISLIPESFSSGLYLHDAGGKKAKVVTSIAVLYDMDDPLEFMRQVHEILDDGGLWVFEQGYMPSMIEGNAYDAICHEHLSYFGLAQIEWMAKRTGFKIIDVEFNAVNGGSFLVVAAKSGAPFKENASLREATIMGEKQKYLASLSPYEKFSKQVFGHRQELLQLINSIKAAGKTIIGYGASTKGNVLLQFCGLTANEIPYIAEINESKIGRYTPYTDIPIISEQAARAMKPDYMLVLPWHFREFFIKKEKAYLANGGRIIFPLPAVEVIEA